MVFPHCDFCKGEVLRRFFKLFAKNIFFFSGLRFTNCKSGKDRTGMSVTLEQVQILSREYDLAEHEYQKALDAMRR